MRRRLAAVLGILLSLGGLLAGPSVPGAGAAGSHRIGVVLPGDHWASSVDGLKEGMARLGYGEGRQIEYLLDNARGDKAQVEAATRRFVAAKVDVVYTITNTALKIVIDVTKPSRTPVVFGSASGPVESGIIPAYATPDAHVTGVTSGGIELVPKRLEMLREAVPRVKRVALIGDRDADSSKAAFRLAAETAPRLGLTIVELRVGSKAEAIDAVKRLERRDADALVLLPSLHAVGAAAEIGKAALGVGMPFAVYQVEDVRQEGALMSYGSSYLLQGRQAAVLVDKILRGVPVSQLPLERPQVHQLILNLDTAQRLGIRFPAGQLRLADELVGGTARR